MSEARFPRWPARAARSQAAKQRVSGVGGGCRGYWVGDDGWSKPASLAHAVFEFAQLVLHVLYFALCVLYFIELLFVKM